MKQKDLSGRQARYLDFFSQFRFEIRHVKGPSNHVDALSRVDLVNLVVSQPDLDTIKTRIQAASSADLRYERLQKEAQLPDSPYSLQDGLVYWTPNKHTKVLVIPSQKDLRRNILQEAHMPQYTGYRGMSATIAFLKQYFT